MLLLLTAAVVASAAVPPSHPVHRAPRALLNRIASAGHAIANPYHPGHYAPSGSGAARRYVDPATLGGRNAAAAGDAAPTRSARQPGLRVRPTDHGADPSGVRDSTTALKAAIGVCLNQSKRSPNGLFPGSTSFPNQEGIRDMGGCIVDLDGGEYKVSAPLVIPEYNANMVMGYGSIVADVTFSPAGSPDGNTSFLIIVGVDGSCRVPQGSCNIDINFPELFLDGSHVASAIQINNVMGVTIGPGGYILNFTTHGVMINKGHEVMIDRCWLGETNFDYDYTAFGAVPNATAIQINGNDHYVLNTIVFSSRVGVEVNGAADYITGTHVWFPMNRALAFMGPPVNAMAFHVTKGGNRFNGCYADGGRCVLDGTPPHSGTTRNIWTNGFECCAGKGLQNVSHGIILKGDTIGPGLQIYGNLFGGGSIWHEPAGPSGPDVAPALFDAGASSNATCSFPVNITGRHCVGLTTAALEGADASATACQDACCKLQGAGSCTMWQWAPATTKGGGCWVDAQANELPCSSSASGATSLVGGASIPLPTGKAGVTDTRIENNKFLTADEAVGTRVGLVVRSTTATVTWPVSFCDHLVFKQIDHVRAVTVTPGPQVSGGPIYGWVSAINGCNVTVTTSASITGSVFVEVDSSQVTGTLI